MGQWFLRKIEVGIEVINGALPLKSTFQYSTIPSFHVRGKNSVVNKNCLISICCINSETLNQAFPGAFYDNMAFGFRSGFSEEIPAKEKSLT